MEILVPFAHTHFKNVQTYLPLLYVNQVQEDREPETFVNVILWVSMKKVQPIVGNVTPIVKPATQTLDVSVFYEFLI